MKSPLSIILPNLSIIILLSLLILLPGSDSIVINEKSAVTLSHNHVTVIGTGWQIDSKIRQNCAECDWQDFGFKPLKQHTYFVNSGKIIRDRSNISTTKMYDYEHSILKIGFAASGSFGTPVNWGSIGYW